MDEQRLLASAQCGDENAFSALVEPVRGEIQGRCRRMLTSSHDAEDAFQEVLLRAWRALPGFEGRSSLRTWLHRIATNVCLSTIAKRPKRALAIPGEHRSDDPGPGARKPVGEPVPVDSQLDEALAVEDRPNSPEEHYERRESLELALVAALQHLTPNQRAALILRESLGFSAQEAAELLGITTASVNSALQRARRVVDERLPERRQQPSLRALNDERLRGVVERYVRAIEEADVPAVATMLGGER